MKSRCLGKSFGFLIPTFAMSFALGRFVLTHSGVGKQHSFLERIRDTLRCRYVFASSESKMTFLFCLHCQLRVEAGT
jgi:hypothetical protein